MLVRSVREMKENSSVTPVELFNSPLDLLLMNYELQNFAGVSTSVAKILIY